jgi:hypothetical protein
MPAASPRSPVLLAFLFEIEEVPAYGDGEDLGNNPYVTMSSEAGLWHAGSFEARNRDVPASGFFPLTQKFVTVPEPS